MLGITKAAYSESTWRHAEGKTTRDLRTIEAQRTARNQTGLPSCRIQSKTDQTGETNR